MDKVGNAGCMCGAVRLNVTGDPVTVIQCHCSDCQKSVGGGAVLIGLFPKTRFEHLSGELSGYDVIGESGEPVRRNFCPTCGSPLYSELGKYPDLIAVKAGIWDEDRQLVPQMAIWTDSAPEWHAQRDDVPTFPQARG